VDEIFFGVLRSHKKCRILKRAGHEAEVRQIGREKQNFSQKCTHSAFSTMHDVFLFSVFFVRTNAMNAAVKVSQRHTFLCFELLSHDSRAFGRSSNGFKA